MPASNREEGELSVSDWCFGVAAFLGVMTVLVLVQLIVPVLYGRPSNAGEFGDMFGVANSVFSGLAFTCLILTLLLQRRELALQRNEIKLSTKALNDQSEAFSKQNRLIAVQRFEFVFFQMLQGLQLSSESLSKPRLLKDRAGTIQKLRAGVLHEIESGFDPRSETIRRHFAEADDVFQSFLDKLLYTIQFVRQKCPNGEPEYFYLGQVKPFVSRPVLEMMIVYYSLDDIHVDDDVLHFISRHSSVQSSPEDIEWPFWRAYELLKIKRNPEREEMIEQLRKSSRELDELI